MGGDGAQLAALIGVRRGPLSRGDGRQIAPEWEARAKRGQARRDGIAACARVAAALEADPGAEPWAFARAAELYARSSEAASIEAADGAIARALEPRRRPARARAERRWARGGRGQSSGGTRRRCLSSAPRRARSRRASRTTRAAARRRPRRSRRTNRAATSDDARVFLLLGRAAVALGDLVAAKVALERAGEHASSGGSRAAIAAEPAEVAYLSGDVALAAIQADVRCSSTKVRPCGSRPATRWASCCWPRPAGTTPTAFRPGRLGRSERGAARRGAARAPQPRHRAALQGLHRRGADHLRGRAGRRRARGRRPGLRLRGREPPVVATLRHDYAQALALTERTLKLRERIGDRLKTGPARSSNLAELRRRLGLLDHAEHAVAFGRRTLGPGMPPAHSAFFSIQSARTALMRGNTVEARREATRALAESEAAGLRNYVCEACCVGARVALEDGDFAARRRAARARPRRGRDRRARAELSLVTRGPRPRLRRRGRRPRPRGAGGRARAPRQGGFVIEAHALLAEIHRAAGRPGTARAHVDAAVAMRDRSRPRSPATSAPRSSRAPTSPRSVGSTAALARAGSPGPAPPSPAPSSPRARSAPPARRRPSRDRRRRPRRARPARRRPQGRALEQHGAGPRRERHGQGARRRRASTARATAPRGPAGHRQLRGARRDAAPERALRPREGRLHRRRRAQARPLRDGRGRHALPRRDRRHLGAHPGGPAARAAGARPSSASAARRPSARRARHLRHAPRPRGAWSSAASSARTCTTACAASPLEVPPLRDAHGGPAAHQRAPAGAHRRRARRGAQDAVGRRARAARPPPLAGQRARARERASRRVALRRGRGHPAPTPRRQRRRPARRRSVGCGARRSAPSGHPRRRARTSYDDDAGEAASGESPLPRGEATATAWRTLRCARAALRCPTSSARSSATASRAPWPRPGATSLGRRRCSV